MIAFLGGSLQPDARSSVEEHLESCGACADLVTWAAADHSSTIRMPGHDHQQPSPPGALSPGAQVGRYQILGAVGRGGMGEVYAAYHPDLDRRIALKVVHGPHGGSGERHVRLLREARAIARLSHPNVITVYDAGTFGDRVFIAMELVDGPTIDKWLRAAPRTWRQILDVFIAAGRGLAAAHAAGVVHRDFKPQNVMIAKSGAVRVMDFGLARLADGGAPDADDGGGADAPALRFMSVTMTGAILGTPAYMSPEQARRAPADQRSDQFSFCVALHEALYGTRPQLATAKAKSTAAATAAPAPTATAAASESKHVPPGGVPSWLRGVVLRGASVERTQRYRSMDELIAALERGRTRLRRRVSVAAVALATLALSAGAWRLGQGHGNRIVCAAPAARVARAWVPGAAGDPRRQAIHRAFTASGRPTAETGWERVSSVLDDYMRGWSALYVQTCEATHVHGEQSAEVLDLRMSCLADNLDQVRALTDALMTADAAVASHAVTAAQELTPVKRCANVTLLRSAVPPPKDERTMREVEALRSSLRDLQVLREIGDRRRVLEGAPALRSRVEATGYKPLLAELLELVGYVRMDVDADPSQAEAMFRDAIVTADACRDDIVAAKAAVSLSFLLSYRLGKQEDAAFTLRLAQASLDRSGPGNERFRAWAVGDEATIRYRLGDFAKARELALASVALREKSVGLQHPDLAVGLTVLAVMSMACDRPDDALSEATRAIEIFRQHGDPEGFQIAVTLSDQGDALNALGRYADAERAFQESLRIFREQLNPEHPESASPLHGLGETRIGQRRPAEAIPLLESALRICGADKCDPILMADTTFALARARAESGGDRDKARRLATATLADYDAVHLPARRRAVEAWLGGQRRP